MTLDTLARQVDELAGAMLEQRTKGRTHRALQRQYQGRPLAFIREVLRGHLTPQQEAVVAAVEAHPLVAVPGAVGVGKDYVATALAMYWAYIEGALVIFQAPTERQATVILMREVRDHFARASDLPGDLFQRALIVPGAHRAAIRTMTSTESSKLTGFHAPDVRVVLSEAQGLEPHAWEAAFSVAIGPRDRIMAVGNPLSPEGRFFDACLAPDTKWHTVTLSALDHPNLLTGRVIVQGGPTVASVQRFKDEYGADSAIYRSRVLAQFPLEATAALFPRDLLMAAVNRTLTPRAGDQVVAGVDTARSKAGSQIGLAVARGGQLTYLTTFFGPDTTQAASRILDELGQFQPSVIRLDVGGPGAGICDILRRTPSPGWRARIEEIHFGGSPHDKDRFLNKRAEMYYGLRERLEQEMVGLPRDAALIEELSQPTFSFDARSRVVIEGKDLIAGRLGRSPDRADAAVMALALPPVQPWVVHRTAY